MTLRDVLGCFCGGVINIQVEEDTYMHTDITVDSFLEPEQALFSDVFTKEFLDREIYVMSVESGRFCVSLCNPKMGVIEKA